MAYNQKNFYENNFAYKARNFKYYLSPILVKNKFTHGFFTKTSSEINLSLLSNHLDVNNNSCILNQIHSNEIVFGSKTGEKKIVEADGMVSDKHNQNLWIYTADCMPILFADKRKRFVAAIHCGRKGLENKIIKNTIKIFYSKGCSKEDLIVAIGPSISKKYYLVDNKVINNFHKHVFYKDSTSLLDDKNILLKLKSLIKNKNQVLFPLDLKKYAHMQLLNENIPSTNIDISNLCTYESNHNFHSWRRSKTHKRQWNFISS